MEKPSRKTIDEFMRDVLAILPDALFDEDATGEIVVSTGFRSLPDGTVLEMSAPYVVGGKLYDAAAGDLAQKKRQRRKK